MWCSCWTELTLLEDRYPTKTSVHGVHPFRSVCVPSVGLYHLFLLKRLPWQWAQEGSRRDSGWWHVWARSAFDRPLYHPPLQLPEKQRLLSSLLHPPGLPQVHVSQLCWRGLLQPQSLPWRLLLESSNGGRTPLSTSELEYCRKQMKLNRFAAWLSCYIIRQHSSGGA